MKAVVFGDIPVLGPPAGWPLAPAPPCCTRPGNGTFQTLSPAREAGRWWMLYGSDGVSSWGFHHRTVFRLRPVSPGRPRLQRRRWHNPHLRGKEREYREKKPEHFKFCLNMRPKIKFLSFKIKRFFFVIFKKKINLLFFEASYNLHYI